MSKIGKQLNQDEIILVKPHVTEKATALATGKSDQPVYIFRVTKSANKKTVAGAVRRLFGVTPTRVNIINSPSKKITVRGRGGRSGHVPGFKKALITLKKGDKIEIV
ncbi:MAG: 50S ribosomal protein L23 [Patescibacteria group bacterium]